MVSEIQKKKMKEIEDYFKKSYIENYDTYETHVVELDNFVYFGLLRFNAGGTKSEQYRIGVRGGVKEI